MVPDHGFHVGIFGAKFVRNIAIPDAFVFEPFLDARKPGQLHYASSC